MAQRAPELEAPYDGPRYLEPLSPIVFPEAEEMPETQLHLELRTLLYQLLSDFLAGATVGSEQFIYFDAEDPRQSLAPDAFVRLEPRGELIRSWKTWERGAPEVAVEIRSDSDARELAWSEKLARYRRLGVRELVRFDPEADAGRRLRIWDRVQGTLQEREISGDIAMSLVLRLCWSVAPADGYACALRIAEDAAGQQLVPTRAEARRVAEAAREVESEARRVAEAAREVAEKRIAELEAELGRRRA